MATCPGNPPPPSGTRVWRKAVSTPLEQWAIDLRDHIAAYPYGTVWTTTYNGQIATARKDYHTWTYRKQADGSVKLITGICIPGITLYEPLPIGAVAVAGDLDNPDATFAMYGADDVQQPPSKTDVPLVVISGIAIVTTVSLFLLALRYARIAAEVKRKPPAP